ADRGACQSLCTVLLTNCVGRLGVVVARGVAALVPVLWLCAALVNPRTPRPTGAAVANNEDLMATGEHVGPAQAEGHVVALASGRPVDEIPQSGGDELGGFVVALGVVAQLVFGVPEDDLVGVGDQPRLHFRH